MSQLGELLKDSAALPVGHPKKLVSINGMTSASGSLPVEAMSPHWTWALQQQLLKVGFGGPFISLCLF